MKKVLTGLFFVSFMANSGPVLEPQELQSLTSTVCSEHADPALCVKAFDKVIGYVKTNDDYYVFCQKSKESGMAVNKDLCDKSQQLREFIDKNAN